MDTDMAEVFESNGRITILNRIVGEPLDELYHRYTFIKNNLDKGNFDNIVNKSFLYVNIFIKKNCYGPEILKKFIETYDCTVY